MKMIHLIKLGAPFTSFTQKLSNINSQPHLHEWSSYVLITIHAAIAKHYFFPVFQFIFHSAITLWTTHSFFISCNLSNYNIESNKECEIKNYIWEYQNSYAAAKEPWCKIMHQMYIIHY